MKENSGKFVIKEATPDILASEEVRLLSAILTEIIVSKIDLPQFLETEQDDEHLATQLMNDIYPDVEKRIDPMKYIQTIFKNPRSSLITMMKDLVEGARNTKSKHTPINKEKQHWQALDFGNP